MKKRNPIKRFTALIVLVALIVCMAGCVQPYTTLEEYAAHEPLPDDISHMSMDMDGMRINATVEIHDNTIVYKFVPSRIIFGKDPKLDSLAKSVMEQQWKSVDTQNKARDLINGLSEATGIAASEISISLEMYNPGADTPAFTYTYPEK